MGPHNPRHEPIGTPETSPQRGSRPATDQYGGVALMLNRAKHGFCETKPIWQTFSALQKNESDPIKPNQTRSNQMSQPAITPDNGCRRHTVVCTGPFRLILQACAANLRRFQTIGEIQQLAIMTTINLPPAPAKLAKTNGATKGDWLSVTFSVFSFQFGKPSPRDAKQLETSN